MQARGGRIEADVGRDALRGEQLRQAFGGVVNHAAPRDSSKRSHRSTAYYTVDGGRPARGAEDASSRQAVGAVGATGAYGYLYERHHLEITRDDDAGLRPAARAGRLRIGLITDFHRSRGSRTRRDARGGRLMAERPDLIVLGGDYVTWGDRRYVEPAAEALRAAVRAARRVRGSRQSRRRPRHAGGADAQRLQRAADARTGSRSAAKARSRRHPILDQARGGHRPRPARRRSTVILLAHDPRGWPRPRPWPCRSSCPATRTADRSCSGVGAVAARSFRSSPVSGAADTGRCSSAGASARSTCRCASTVRPKSRC